MINHRPLIDPIVSLAVSMQSNPGIYAVLLGSGVSRSSGIPTGWDIVIDLIRKVACSKKLDCNPDPVQWYSDTFGHKPSYSRLIDAIELSRAARTQLLRGYFEPTNAEREEGKKTPSTGHRALAQLVLEGYVRVILSTNFDRLMEQSLTEVGVNPVVISSDEAAAGMMPLAHTRAMVVKLNGDFLDPQFRNTEDELEEYGPALRDLLDRTLDEFGLLICGWSADWDIGLRNALERCKSHRFTTYWLHQGSLGEQAQKLVQLRRGNPISIADSDSFFSGLLENVRALRDLQIAEPLSQRVAVASLKRYLPEERHRIQLRDLIHTETERAYHTISDRARLNQFTGTEMDQYRAHVRYHETGTSVLRALIFAGVYFGEDQQDVLWSEVLARLGTPAPLQTGFSFGLERYPALLVLYCAGIASVAAGRFRTLRTLLDIPVQTDRGGFSRVQERLNPYEIMPEVHAKKLEGMRDLRTPISDHLLQVLRTDIQPYVPPGWNAEDTFDWFEYLRALIAWDEKDKIGGRFLWSLARSGWLKAVSDPDGLGSKVREVLAAGFFGGELERYRAAREEIGKFIKHSGFDW